MSRPPIEWPLAIDPSVIQMPPDDLRRWQGAYTLAAWLVDDPEKDELTQFLTRAFFYGPVPTR